MAWIIVAAMVAVLVPIVVARSRARSRSTTLKRRFGPEYDRLVARAGDRRTVESHLHQLVKRREELDIHDPDVDDLSRFRQRWHDLQLGFVDDPAASVAAADELLTEVVTARGYPTGKLGGRLALLSVDHPRVVESYRAAVTAPRRDLDDLRTAFRKYRTVFDELAGDGVRRPLRLVHSTKGNQREDHGRTDRQAGAGA
jgi:hypothetical protein